MLLMYKLKVTAMRLGILVSVFILVFSSVLLVRAQYSDIINGLTNAIMPAVSGSSSYKGYVEADYTQGVGNYKSNFMTVCTSQGYKFTPWFYMGAGIGVDLLWSTVQAGWGDGWSDQSPEWYNHEKTESAVMIPVFTDFRFNFGSQTSPSFFVNLRAGAAFLCSDSYVKIKNGYLTNNSYFYLQPSVGIRIPVSITKPRQAVNVGLHYRLMTSDYWCGWEHNAVINGLGANISYEW